MWILIISLIALAVVAAIAGTVRNHFLHFGHSVQFAFVNFLLESAVAYGSGYGSYDGKGNQANNQYPEEN